jgi:transcription elongation GreA/GreB family factor
MSLSRELRRAIERGDFETVEDDWLGRLDQDPHQLDYFVDASRSLAGAGQGDRARVLLDLVDEHQRKNEEWQRRLILMERVAELHPSGELLHEEIFKTLERVYEGQPSLAGLVDLVGLHRAVGDIPKTWEKVHRLRELMQFEMGTVVAMEGKGVGRIVEVNLELSSFKIDFDAGGEIRVGFKAAAKLLQPLAKDHFLRRKVEAPEELSSLAPNEQLQRLLASYDRALTAGEIKQAMTGLVEPSRWNSWWTAARKHRQVVSKGAGAKRTYRWAGSGAEAGQAFLDQFGSAKVGGKLAIFRKEAGHEGESGDAMSARLIELGEAAHRSRPEEAFAIAAELERAGSAPEESDWSTEALARESGDPSPWVMRIEDKALRRLAFERIRTRDDWTSLFARMAEREDDARLLDYLSGELRSGDAAAFETLIDHVLAHPRRHSGAFVWAAERIDGDDVLGDRNPLRLLQMVTSVGERPEFQAYKPRLKKLVADSGCLAALLTRVDEAQAEQAEEALRRAHLEEYQRERLTTALHLRFPDLRKEQESGLYATESSIAARREELKHLLETEIPTNRKAIEEAREMGDLRENFEYKSARQRHEYLSARVAELDGELRRVQPIDISQFEGNEVRVGSVVRLRGPKIGERTITILGPWESRPEEGIVSYESDLAKLLLGKGPGEVLQALDDEVTIESIELADLPS